MNRIIYLKFISLEQLIKKNRNLGSNNLHLIKKCINTRFIICFDDSFITYIFYFSDALWNYVLSMI